MSDMTTGIILLFILAVILVLMGFDAAYSAKGGKSSSLCERSHKWRYNEEGDLVCIDCNRKAKDVLNG
jgi:hypothetical protein